MTKFCDSCGQGLLDSDRFCDECGADQSTRPLGPEAYRKFTGSVPETELEPKTGDVQAGLAAYVPKEEADTLRARLRELESILAVSVPRREAEAELETVTRQLRGEIAQLKEKNTVPLPRLKGKAAKAELLDKVTKLETRLAESIPRGEAEQLHAKVEELEKKLAASKSEEDSLRMTIAQLQDRLAESVSKAESEAKVNELEARLSAERRQIEVAKRTIEDLKARLSESSAKIDELQDKLSEPLTRTEFETTKGQLESEIVSHEAKSALSAPRSQADELRSGVSVASKPAQTFPKLCPRCNYRNLVDAIFCARCGHMLDTKAGKVEKEGMKLIAHLPTERASTVTPSTTSPLIADQGRLSKLKSLLGPRYRPQKNVIWGSSRVQSGDMLEAQLTKLKSLYDSGALTEAEYSQQKRTLLTQL